MKYLYEVLVPTMYGDTEKPIKTRHHREWDKVVRSLSEGLTILKPGKGQWVFQNKLYEERIIPVRIFTTEKNIKKIIDFTIIHYRQKCVMYYVLTKECYLIYANT